MRYSAQQIATLLGGTLEGDPAHTVTTIAKIEDAHQEALSFIANAKYEHFAQTADAGILLVNETLAIRNKQVGAIIRVSEPYIAFTKLLEIYHQTVKASDPKSGIETPSHIGEGTVHGEGLYLGAFAYIGKGVTIGTQVQIYPGAYIGDGVQIGDATVIYAGAKIYEGCTIGTHCTIHAGAVIGSDGFGFAPQADGTFKKVPQTGVVQMGNYVEVGSNTTIDRATIGATIIQDGVKLDNLVHIAHNVEIGDNTAIAAQTGVSGSTRIGKSVMIGGQVGIVGHIHIADGVKINAQSGVSKSITAGRAVTGSPATDFREHYKGIAHTRLIPDLIKRIQDLERRLDEDQ
jgi:UDP-3-O-[3-hydroxymyristoyl] glucosamine N-acyltransferase